MNIRNRIFRLCCARMCVCTSTKINVVDVEEKSFKTFQLISALFHVHCRHSFKYSNCANGKLEMTKVFAQAIPITSPASNLFSIFFLSCAKAHFKRSAAMFKFGSQCVRVAHMCAFGTLFSFH